MTDDPEKLGQDEVENLLRQAADHTEPDASEAADSPADASAPDNAPSGNTPTGDTPTGDAAETPADAAPDRVEEAEAEADAGAAADAEHERTAERSERPREAGPKDPSGPLPTPPAGVASTPQPAAPYKAVASGGTADDMEVLLSQAEQAIASVDQPTESELDGLSPYQLRDFAGTPPSTDKATLELLRDVELDLKIELGRTLMPLEEVLGLRRGSVVPLDKLAGDPVDIYVNGRLVARGEVLVLNDNFCVRVAELVSTEQR